MLIIVTGHGMLSNWPVLRTLLVIVNDNNNVKSGAPPAQPPPPPPADLADLADLADSMDSQAELSFNLELSLYQQEHYGTQFSAEPTGPPPQPPPVTIVGEYPRKPGNQRISIAAVVTSVLTARTVIT